ncbi:sporulation protein YjcZ [Halobacillus halophilus]|uniref:Sporulation protein YjcZ n=1 Tax=Halobacillus halophilus (strain ATCC 35676 / DSM 2266 / JCM 20832 / KCTC 3685 / LMG 17431 / NBRC 102448 / NCIMB 2269) TaxID=866895 RepID=I0JL91_HALH3|nr:sporulation protein YjcZ [Halobacillus halophilus]CCG44911.1 hypothetical protein HBHAL_2565 [Halobacillus halophilus DSM 2266]
MIYLKPHWSSALPTYLIFHSLSYRTKKGGEDMGYGGCGYGGGYGGGNYGSTFVLIVVLFILLIIVGASFYN